VRFTRPHGVEREDGHRRVPVSVPMPVGVRSLPRAEWRPRPGDGRECVRPHPTARWATIAGGSGLAASPSRTVPLPMADSEAVSAARSRQRRARSRRAAYRVRPPVSEGCRSSSSTASIWPGARVALVDVLGGGLAGRPSDRAVVDESRGRVRHNREQEPTGNRTRGVDLWRPRRRSVGRPWGAAPGGAIVVPERTSRRRMPSPCRRREARGWVTSARVRVVVRPERARHRPRRLVEALNATGPAERPGPFVVPPPKRRSSVAG
jgi:hypothetical protein